MVSRAVDDPTNSLHVVSALRTPLLASGDDDLFRFKVERGGLWDYLRNLPATVPADDPVRRGLAFLRALHDEHMWPWELYEMLNLAAAVERCSAFDIIHYEAAYYPMSLAFTRPCQTHLVPTRHHHPRAAARPRREAYPWAPARRNSPEPARRAKWATPIGGAAPAAAAATIAH